MRHGRLLLLVLVATVLILPGAAAAQDSETTTQDSEPATQDPELVAHDSESTGSEDAEPTVELQSGEEAVADEVLVKFKEEASEVTKDDVRSDEGLEKKEDLDLVDAEVDKVEEGQSVEETIEALEARPEVEKAEPNHILKADDYSKEPRFASEELWGLHNTKQIIDPNADDDILGTVGTDDVDVNAPEAWSVEATQGGKDIVVAVIDDGVDFSHPDLEDRAWKNPGESGEGKETNGLDDDNNGYVDDVYGWDFHNDNNTVYDPLDQHGTHVAGTIAASANGEGVVGVAPNVKIMALKFLDPRASDGASSGTTENAIKAIGYAKKMGAKISNNSWGGEPYNSLLKQAIDESEMLFVAAAGNDGRNNDGSNPHYPASYKPEKDGDPDNILSVAAIDNQGQRPGFSNYGANSVDISAPGASILSSYPAAPAWPGVALSDVGSSGKAVVAGFGVEEITGTASQSAADARGSFMKQALEAVGRGNQQVVLVDDDASTVRSDTPSPFGFPDVQPALKEAIQKATGTAPQVFDVPYGFSIATSSWPQFQGKTIVWSTGQAWLTYRIPGANSIFTTLSPTDQQNLTNFLNGGGKLILTGRDALYLIEDKPFTFVDKTLGLDVMRDVKSTRFNESVSLTGINGAAGTKFEGGSYALTNAQTTLGRPASVRHDFVIPEEAKARAQGSYNVPATSATWKYLNGTSMATPHATGAAVLAASINPALLEDPDALKKAVLDGGKPAPATEGETLTEDMIDARSALTKADKSAPQISGTSDLIEEATSAAGAKVSFPTTIKATDNVDGESTVTCTSDSGLESGDTFPLGTIEVTCNATDEAGNKAEPSRFNVRVQDTTPPEMSGLPTSDLTEKATSAAGAKVNFPATIEATDIVDGEVVVSCASAPPDDLKSGDTFPVGITEVTCNATDKADNKATGEFNVKVYYDFRGFFSPVDNLPTLNTVNAGRGIPVKFGLNGDQGLDIFAEGYPKSVSVACPGSNTSVDAIEETTSSASGLYYDPATDQYNYVWKTNRSWAGTCQQFIVKLKDGTEHKANFKFK